LGTSGRNVRNWLENREKYPELQIDGQARGKRCYYILADGVESLARRLGRWPPAQFPTVLPESADAATWQELLVRQGHDLDDARRAHRVAESQLVELRVTYAELRHRVRKLETQARQLSIALEASAKVNREEFAGSGDPDDASP
jgi:hypothetical protein